MFLKSRLDYDRAVHTDGVSWAQLDLKWLLFVTKKKQFVDTADLRSGRDPNDVHNFFWHKIIKIRKMNEGSKSCFKRLHFQISEHMLVIYPLKMSYNYNIEICSAVLLAFDSTWKIWDEKMSWHLLYQCAFIHVIDFILLATFFSYAIWDAFIKCLEIFF